MVLKIVCNPNNTSFDPKFHAGIPPPAGVPKIRTLHSPIANLEHPFALIVIDDAVARTPLPVRNAKGCSKLAIGECRVRISET